MRAGSRWVESVPLKYLFSFRSGTSRPSVESGDIPVMGASGVLGYTSLANCTAPSLLIGRVGTVGNVTPVNSLCWASDNVIVAVPLPRIEFRFAYYCLTAKQLHLLASETAQPLITATAVGNARVDLPPMEVQCRIADFLDAELARSRQIEQLRSAQLRSLADLELSLIASCLSGQDLQGDRQGTPWSWLPNIPVEWQIGPVYAYFDVLLGKMLNAERAAGAHPRAYLRNANVHWYGIDTNDLAQMSFEPGERLRYSLRKGDLLACEGGAGVAEAAVWDGRIEECYYQKSLHRVRAIGSVPVEWLMYWLRLAKDVGLFAAEGNIATIPHLTGEQLRSYRIPIPSDGRQRVVRLQSEIEQLQRARALLHRANAVLAERRQTLIAAAVTGQIEPATARGVDV